MKKFNQLLLSIVISICICCSSNSKPEIKFEVNASTNDIPDDIRLTVMQEDFYVVFFSRNDSNYGWYKLLSRKGNFWEKIEIRQNIIDEQQLREDPDYYISRDITTRKLCRDEEAKLFLSKLKSYGLFELPEEKVLFRNCEDSKVTDMGYKYILIVSGNKVRKLEYSGIYKCSHGERDNLYKIEELFKNEWFENTLCK